MEFNNLFHAMLPNLEDVELELNEKQKMNKKYYSENKGELQKKYKTVVKCVLCDREVTHGALRTHMSNSLCKRGQDIKKQLHSIINPSLTNL